jgi:hypothetical protein
MATEIPAGIEFQHLLSHTFPGFLSAITLFMLIDIWSPVDLTSLVIKDLTGLINFVGFILLIGTILGIIIDGIHHSIVEDGIFDRLMDMNDIHDIRRECATICGVNKNISHHYFFSKMKSDAVNISTYFVKGYYCYSEFYSNTFLSLLPFSLVVPFYLVESLQIPWHQCIFIGIGSLILACACLYSGYVAYKGYVRAIYSTIYGYIKGEKAK